MKKAVCKLLLVLIIISIFSCCQDMQIPQFNFDPIAVNENVIFMRGRIGGQRVLFALDTSSDRIIQKYQFADNAVNTFVHSSQISDQIVVLLNYESCFFVLNPATGSVYNYNVDYYISDLIFAEKKVIIKKNVISYKGQTVNCKSYNLLTNSLENFTVPEGDIASRISCNIEIDNKYYLPVSYDGYGSAGNAYPTIYNITDNRIIDFFPERDYVFFHFVGDRYLYAYKEETYLADVYKVESFEPVDANIIYSYQESDNMATGLRIFEDEDYLYVIDQPRDCQRITKRNKSDYSIVKQKVITTNYEGGTVPYYKNDHFWVVSREDEGAYKISKDLEISVVK